MASELNDSRPEIDIEELDAPADEALSISRRTFFAGIAGSVAAAGFMAALPRVPGGYLSPVFGPSVAYANPNDAHFVLTVVGADQVGFQVVDVATLDASGNGTPVPRAKIKVISRKDSSKYVEGETNEKGEIIFDIGDLALLDENGNLLQDVYQFNATVQVDGSACRPVMRDFTAALLHVEGASGYVIAVHAMEDDDDTYGYIERFGFDDWDIYYTKNQFSRSAENDFDHWITVRVKNLPEAILGGMGTPLTAKFTERLKKDGKYTGETKDRTLTFSTKKHDYDADKKTYTAMFTGKFLQQGDDNCFNADEVKLTFEYPVGKKRRKVTTTLYTEEAPLQGAKYKSPMTPFLTGNGVLGSISSSNDWPVFNNADISIINWKWPVKLFYTPRTIMLSIGTQMLATGDDGAVKDWKDQNQDSLKQRYERAWGKYADDLKKLGTAKPFTTGEGDNKQNVSHKWAGGWSLNLIMGVVFGMQYEGFKGEGENVTKLFEGQICAGIGLDLKGSISFKFAIASIPFYITITGGLELAFAGTFVVTEELIMEERLNANGITWVPNGSMSINIKPSFKLSVGVGLEGVASVSVSGTIALPMYIGWLEPKPDPDDDDTHFTVGYTFKAELCAQLVCFSGSVSIWSKAENPFYDNWHKSPVPPLPEVNDVRLWGEGAGARFLHTLPDGTVGHTTVMTDDGRLLVGNSGDIFDDMLPVTMEDMGHSYEAEATKGLQPVSFSEDELPDIHRNMIPMVVELENGTLVTQFVPCEGVNTFTYADELAATVMGLETKNKRNLTPFVAVAYADEPSPDVDDKGDADNAYLIGDPLLGFGAPSTAEYEYANVEGKTTGAVCGLGGVKGIGLHDGIKPSVDVVIYNNVFSDPRQKIVNINGAPYLFRIMTVDYSFKGAPVRRPRVVCSRFDTAARTWGEPKVIEYGSGTNKLKRIDMFDYDFDIVTRSAGTSWTRHVEACLVVTGGLRPQGDDTSIYDAFATPTVAIVFLDENLDVFQRTVKQASDLYNDGLSHMVSVPRVCDGFAAGGASGAVAFAFLHRSASEPRNLMSDPTSVSFGMGYCYLRDGAVSVALKAGRIIDPDSDTPIYVDPIELDKSVTSMDLIVGNGVKGKYDALVTLIFYKTEGYEVCSALIPHGKSFADIQVKRNIVSSATLPQIAAWPGHGTVLFAKHHNPDADAQPSDYYLYAGVFDPYEENQPGFEDSYERVDFNGFKGNTFAVSPTGKYLFYYESFDGNPGDDIDPKTGEHTPVEEHIYRIMASRYMNGAFSEDFPFAELDSPIDGFAVMNITDDTSTFLATEITDADHSLSRLRYIAVANTLSAEVEGFAEFDPFVCAGKTCEFQIDVRNHGNLIIGGFDVAMFDADGGMAMVGDPFTAQTIDPSRVLTTATSRRKWMDDVQIPAEQAYANLELRMQEDASDVELQTAADDMEITEIMPGEVLSYRVEFDIPAGWRDKREVVVRLTNVRSPGIQVAVNELPAIEAGKPITAMLSTSEGPVALHLHEGVAGSFELDTAEASAELHDPLEEIVDEDNPAPDPKPEPKPEPKPRPMPDTGDVLPGFVAPMAAAIGGLGALMAAYSMRRVQNERGEGIIDVDGFDPDDE